MKRIKLLFTAGFLLSTAFAFADGITVSVDSNSTYSPTNIVNGSFEDRSKLVSYTKETADYHPGTNNGWGTTDTWGFELSSSMSTYGWSGYAAAAGSNFVEMNNHYASILYQDLSTQPNDVIRWTLAHASRKGSGWKNPQTMHVEIGQSDGNYPSGYGDSKNTHIVASTLGKYTSSGVSGYNCYGNDSELTALSVYQTAESSDYTNSKCWYKATGIYIIPANQTITRFAFISDDTDCPGGGNLLDDITFSTLIGNLNAYADWDASVVITGYWGETDTTKQLYVKAGDNNINKITMSAVTGKNFKIVIPQSIIGSATSVKIYHQDYESASKTVAIERHYHGSELYGVWNYSTKLPTTGRYALAKDVTLTSDVTLTGSADMVSYGGAKICLNGHTISGAKVIINSGSYKLTIDSIKGINSTETAYGSITSGLEVKGGDFTLNGGNVTTLTYTGGSFTVSGLVNISSISIASGKAVTVGSDINSGSVITLCSTPATGVITIGYSSFSLGTIFNLPSGATTYMLLKTKSGELKVTKHK